MHRCVTPWLECLGSTHPNSDLFLASSFWCHYFNHPRTNFPASDKMSTSLIRIQGKKTTTRPNSLSLDNTRCWLWALRTLWMCQEWGWRSTDNPAWVIWVQSSAQAPVIPSHNAAQWSVPWRPFNQSRVQITQHSSSGLLWSTRL